MFTYYLFCKQGDLMTINIAARMPDLVAKDIDYIANEENVDRSKVIRELLSRALKEKLVDLALDKYRRGKVSIGRAAELAKIPLADFMKLTAERKITVHYDMQDLKEDIGAAREAK